MDALRGWLLGDLLLHERNAERLKGAVAVRCRELRIEPFVPERIDRLIRSAIAAFEEEFCCRLTDAVSLATQQALDGLLLTNLPESGRVPLHQIRVRPVSRRWKRNWVSFGAASSRFAAALVRPACA